MFQDRKYRRYSSLAAASIPAVFEGEAILKDLSVTGCRIEISAGFHTKPGSRHTMTILPEAASGVEEFEIDVEVCWIHPENYNCEVGFSIVKSPRKKFFQRYVDYLVFLSNI
jgi:hypothetical protein